MSTYQWELLGETAAAQSKTAMTLCAESCKKFTITLCQWTRHSDGAAGELSLRNMVLMGVFQQIRIKSTAKHLQNCKTTLIFVVSSAAL